jgi:hypothetical protein
MAANKDPFSLRIVERALLMTQIADDPSAGNRDLWRNISCYFSQLLRLNGQKI